MPACWVRHFTSGTLEKTFIKAAGLFQGRASVICGQLLVKYNLQIFLWFHMSRFLEFLQKEELHCKTGACMHWSNTLGKYIKAWWHPGLGCVTALRTVPCSPAASLSGKGHCSFVTMQQTKLGHTVWYKIQSVPCSAPWLFWSSCCSAPVPCLLGRKAVPAWLARGSAPWGNRHKRMEGHLFNAWDNIPKQ